MTGDRLKLVVIHWRSLNRRELNELRLDELSQYFDVEYWDCGLLDKDLSKINKNDDKVEREYAYTIHNYKELSDRLSLTNDKTIAIIRYMTTYTAFKVNKIISKKIKCGSFLDLATFAYDCDNSEVTRLNIDDIEQNTQSKSQSNKESLFKRIKRHLYSIEFVIYTSKLIKFRGDDRFYRWKDNHYALKIADLYQKYHRAGITSSSDIRICSPDFDKILSLETQEERNMKPYIVFLDSYYPLHYDWKQFYPNYNWEALCEPYYNSLNAFFEKVEKQYNCDVIIAAHPVAKYTHNPFDGRQIVEFKSVEMAKNAQAVIMHGSGSIAFTIYYNKPFCFVTNGAIREGDFFKHSMQHITQRMAEELKVPLVDMDSCDDVKDIFKVLPESTRHKFIKLYMGDVKSHIPYTEHLRIAIEKMYKD